MYLVYGLSAPWLRLHEIVPRGFKFKSFISELKKLKSYKVGHFHIWNFSGTFVGSIALHCNTVEEYTVQQGFLF